MKYDPIMCMMVPDSVKTKDESYVVRGKKYKVVKRDGDNVTVIGPDGKVTKMHIDLLMSKGTKTKDANKNEGFKIHKAEVRGDKLYLTYTDLLYGGKETESFTKKEAKGFLTDPWNTWEGNTKSVMMKFVNDSNTIDKAITTCDKTEFDPQDTRYIRKAIGNLKIASSLLGMINEGTVNKAKQNIANSISLLESID